MQAENSLYIYPATNKIKVTEIYYGGLPEIPKGFEQADFRPPKRGDVYISKANDKAAIAPHNFDINEPRIILARRKQSFKGLRCTVSFSDIYGKDDIKIPEGYEFEAFRVPEIGEYLIAIGGRVLQHTFGTIGPRLIVSPK